MADNSADDLGQIDPVFLEPEFRRLMSNDIQSRLPTHIGFVELIEELGRGGMGSVWLGRESGAIQREVAVKLIQPDLVSAEFVRRFEEERRVLASLDHPGIPKVFQAGAVQSLPYLIMERVQGDSLSVYCRARKVGLRQRLSMFRDVCLAVQHAHDRGVIHRDLKPENIMVAEYDGEPHVKVIDFGLARGVQDISGNGADRSLSAGAGSADYMSPEQSEESTAAVDHQSDQYSLGIILYELLTGTTPFLLNSASGQSGQKTGVGVQRRDIPLPSEMLSQEASLRDRFLAQCPISERKLKRYLRSELDWVVEHALSFAKGDRYENVKDLGADINSFLHDRETQVRRPSAYRRTLRNFKRNQIRYLSLFVAPVIFLLGTILGLLMFSGRSDAEQLFNDQNVASAAQRSGAFLRFISEQRNNPVPEEQSLVNSSHCRGKIGLFNAQLQEVNVGYEKDLRNLCLYEANLHRAAMSNCRFGGSVLGGADLRGATLNGSDFTNVDFSAADCEGANFNNSAFLSAKFSRCNLSGARLENACIATVTNWDGAILRDANLKGAVVASADWIAEVAEQVADPESLKRWVVEPVPNPAVLADDRYRQFGFWVQPADPAANF